jgi:single-strand DNA-binding protein
MYNEAQFSVAGYVATDPVYSLVGDGIPRLRMRVSWTTRRRDPATGDWGDGNTSWISVTCWRRLADNLRTCLRKGDPVIIRGRLDVRTFTGKDGVSRTSVDVDASLLGHDLSRGVAGFQKVLSPSAKVAADDAGADATAGEDPVLAAVPGGTDGDDDMFDDSAIEALAKETDTVGTPF